MIKTQYYCNVCSDEVAGELMKLRGWRIKYTHDGFVLCRLVDKEASERIICAKCLERLQQTVTPTDY